MLARTDASERLKRTAVTVSVDVGRVRFETAALLQTDQRFLVWTEESKRTSFHPILAPSWMPSQTVDHTGDDLWSFIQV